MRVIKSMVSRLFLVTLIILAAVAGSVVARQIEGVDVPPQQTVEGTPLALNGAGLRTVSIAWVPIKAYVATFYAPKPLRTAAEVMAATGPLRFDFTFLRTVGQADVTKAWNSQFDASVSAPYAGLAQDQAAFVKMFGPLQSGGVETVVLTGDETKVYDGGTFKGSVAGRDFQQAFLSLWFGSKPVMPSLKADLLGK